MSIYQAKYGRYEGPLESPHTRFWVIADTEFRRLVRQKWVRRFLLMAWIPVLSLGVMLYVSMVLETETVLTGMKGDVFVKLFRWETVFVAILMAAFGSDMIAKDRQSRALSIYFTRPLSAMQYLWGKFCAITLMILAVTLLPGIVLATAQMLMGKKLLFGRYLDMLWRLVFVSGLFSFVCSSIILLLSSVGTRSRTIGTLWLFIFVALDITRAVILDAVGDMPFLDLISVWELLLNTTRLVFLEESEHWAALVSLLLLGSFCFTALYFRIQKLAKSAT